MSARGVRGATVAKADTSEAILAATKELLVQIMASNPTLASVDIACCIFTTTHDLKSAYPAQAAREIGWDIVPLMCAQEIPVPGSLRHCIRILIIWNTDLHQNQIKHVYLEGSSILRPDLSLDKGV
jgi:chorismate mutase